MPARVTELISAPPSYANSEWQRATQLKIIALRCTRGSPRGAMARNATHTGYIARCVSCARRASRDPPTDALRFFRHAFCVWFGLVPGPSVWLLSHTQV